MCSSTKEKYYITQKRSRQCRFSMNLFFRPTNILTAFSFILCFVYTWMIVYPDLNFSFISSQLDKAIDQGDNETVHWVIENFTDLSQKQPTNVLINRQLARAYISIKQYDKAIEVLQSAQNIAPDHLMIRRELGLVYILSGQAEKGLQILSTISNNNISIPVIESILQELLTDNNYPAAHALLTELDITAKDAEQIANEALAQGDGTKAYYWLLSAQILDSSLSDQLSLRLIAALHMSDIQTAQRDHTNFTGIPFYTLSSRNDIEINGGDFLWLTARPEQNVFFGDPASTRSPQPKMGVLWWNGRVAAFIKINQPGLYRLQLRMQHSLPPPIVVNVYIDQEKIYQVHLSRGDGEWSLIDSLVNLEMGSHMISIAFVNDDVVNGIDRNAYIDKIILTKIIN